MSGWKELRLGDICDVRDGTHDSPKQSHSGRPLVTSKNLKNGNISLENTYLISEEDFFQINKRSKVDKYDILFSMIGTVGEMAIVKDEPNFAIKNIGLFKCNNDYNLAKWIYYYLKSGAAKEELQASMKGSTQAYISLGDLRKFPILLPDSAEQKSIASVLSSLDDKIDLLHRQNKTLEAMAETLFRQWFVEGVGEDWEVRKLGELVVVKRGGSPRPIQDYLSDSGLRWLKISDATKTPSPYVFDIKECIKVEGLNKTTLLKKGTLVLSNSATPGIPKILQVDSCIHDGWLHFPESYFSNEFLYLLFKKIRPELLNLGNGSIFTNLKTDILKEYEMPIPDAESLNLFQASVVPMFEKILSNAIQIECLEKLRDSLLPKLMSGEVRVAHA